MARLLMLLLLMLELLLLVLLPTLKLPSAANTVLSHWSILAVAFFL